MKKFVKITILFFAVMTSQTVFGDTYFKEKKKCPICDNKFEITVIGSYTTFGSKKDFQEFGAIGILYEIMINSCPKCCYSGYNSDFDTTFTEKTKAEIRQILEPYKETKIDDVLECEIAAKIYLYFNAKNNEVAYIYLVASYLLKYDTAQVIKRKELQKECITYLQKAIENQEYDNAETPVIYYLIGELYRRIGDFDNAVKYFDMVLGKTSDNKKKKKEKKYWLIEVATEQREMAIKKDDRNDI